MSTRLRQLTGRDVAAALVKLGFEVVATRGSHCKLRRTLSSGQWQTLTIPLHRSLVPGTLYGLYRQATRFVPEVDLRPYFFTGESSKPAGGPRREKSGTRRRRRS